MTKHDTTRSALEEAREYIRKGYHDVLLTDVANGARIGASEISKKLDLIDDFYRDSW